MNKEFVPYQESLELKELGFDEACFGYYDEEDQEKQVYEYANCSRNITGDRACYNDDFLSVTNTQLDKYGAFSSKDDEDTESYSRWTAPLYQQAFRWFREKYKLCGTSQYFTGGFYCYTINDMQDQKESNRLSTEFETYEEAELACLKNLIEIVKQNG